MVRQHGISTLTISLALLIAITIISYAVAYTANTEQRIALNEQIYLDSFQAAEAGLAHGIQWLSTKRPNWLQIKGQLIATPDKTPKITAINQDSFAINTIFQTNHLADRTVKLTSDASGAHSPEINTKLSIYVKPVSILTDHGEDAPPLSLDGCITATHGKPRLLPDVFSSHPVSLQSSRSRPCLSQSSFQIGNGSISDKAFPSNHLWETLFGITKQAFYSLANDESKLKPTDRNYWWATPADLTGGRWTKSIGSPTKPVVLVIPSSMGCSEFGAGVTIYGLVYVDADCGSAKPWGHVNIHGALAIAGNSGQLGDTVQLTHISHASGNPPRLLPPPIAAIPIPGTWIDQ